MHVWLEPTALGVKYIHYVLSHILWQVQLKTHLGLNGVIFKVWVVARRRTLESWSADDDDDHT